MPVAGVVWVIDTSSIIEVRRAVSNANRKATFAGMTRLVNEGRLVYPHEVLKELKRNADPKTPDDQYLWADANAQQACEQLTCNLDDVRAVLAQVPTVLDPDKDGGEEEADPYVLAVARKLRAERIDARVVTQELKDTPVKMSMSTAARCAGYSGCAPEGPS